MTEKKMPRRDRGTDEIASALYESLNDRRGISVLANDRKEKMHTFWEKFTSYKE
jgi:hypothetical protein